MKCKICGKEHLFADANDLTPSQRRNLDTTYHHLFDKGFVGCLVQEDKVIEYYEKLARFTIEINIEEQEEKRNLAKEYECFQIYDEDDYDYL
jgi:hypothetical protein